MRPPPVNDSYFVRFDSTTPVGMSAKGRTPVERQNFEASRGPRRRRRRRERGRTVFMLLVLFALGGWLVWASGRPGGVSGTVNGWISNVRGDVAKASVDPDLSKAVKILDSQYAQTSTYQQMSADQLQAVGIGATIDVQWCSNNAEVVHGGAGGGTASVLLIAGHSVGTVYSAQGCPADLGDPTPWKLKSN